MTTLFEKLFNIYTGTIVSSLVTAILLSSAFVLGAIMSLGMAFLPLLHKQGRAVTASASRCCLPTSSASSARAAPPARAPRRTRRVHARRDRAEPAAPRQAGGSGAPDARRVRCVSVACVSAVCRRRRSSRSARQPRGFETPVSPLRALPIPDFCNKICHNRTPSIVSEAPT
jgi:hypothetical protein